MINHAYSQTEAPRTIHLRPRDPENIDGQVKLSVAIEGLSGIDSLWYMVPENSFSWVTRSLDPFVVGTVQMAMTAGANLEVHGSVSRSLLQNLEDFIRAWAIWKPNVFKSIGIRAHDEVKQDKPFVEPAAVCGFSGGLDSSFTSFRHATGSGVRYSLPLKAGVMVHGFDIPLDEPDEFRRAFAKAKQQMKSLGLELIPVATNFMSLPVNWSLSFGSGVASVLMLFSRRFDRGLIAQGVPFGSLNHFYEGSNPLTDPLLSSALFRIIADGAGFDRFEKAKIVSQWPEALRYMRVCWEGAKRDRNCCECEKCIRTILTFRVMGLGLPECFEHDVSDDQIANMRHLKPIKLDIFYQPMVQIAEAQGIGGESWVQAVRRCIRRNRIQQWVRKMPGAYFARRVKGKIVRLLRP